MSAIVPNLLNPTTVEFAQKNDANTRQDHRRRTPINRVVTDTKFTVQCQTDWSISSDKSNPENTNVGLDEQERGYVIVRTLDLKKINKTLKAGDRITKIAGMDVLFYVLRLEYGSHYAGEFRLVKVHYHDRKGQDG